VSTKLSELFDKMPARSGENARARNWSMTAEMTRISRQTLVSAVVKVQAMSVKEKEQLAGEVFKKQPHVLASCLVQKQLGVCLEKMEFLVELMLICFQAMKESGLTWPLITEDEQERQMARYVGAVPFGEDLTANLRDRAMAQYVEAHPEKELLAFVQGETTRWLQRTVPDETDKYVVLAAMTLVNCIAFIPVPG
jgi:hypothetical protein